MSFSKTDIANLKSALVGWHLVARPIHGVWMDLDRENRYRERAAEQLDAHGPAIARGALEAQAVQAEVHAQRAKSAWEKAVRELEDTQAGPRPLVGTRLTNHLDYLSRMESYWKAPTAKAKRLRKLLAQLDVEAWPLNGFRPWNE